MSRKIWIYAELQENRIASSYYELLGWIKTIHDEKEIESVLTAVTVAGTDACMDALLKSGADNAIAAIDPQFEAYDPELYIDILTDAARENAPDIFLFPASNTGSELAPSVAARLKTGLVAHASEIRADSDGKLHMLVPAFGGKLMADNTIPTARPLMVSVKPGVFDRMEIPAVTGAKRIDLDVSGYTGKNRAIKFIRRRMNESGDVPVEKADVVVCAGLGSAVSGNLDKVKRFASCIGASVGYTRPLSDLGYYPDEAQMIGTSGKTIKPKVYIGFGNSGAGQHVCGIKDSGIIININNDADAQCFDVSDYKVVSDCGAILDALIEKF